MVVIPQDCVPTVHISPFGVIPKKHKPGKWRLILDLSSPAGLSVNDGIDKDLCSLSYISIDEVVKCIISQRQGAMLAKIDVKQAYRNIPVHPEDRPLLGMAWRGKVYLDKVLPFGLRSAPLIFSAIADALQWIIQAQGVEFLFHYLDDFITIGKPGTLECENNLSIIKHYCDITGTPLEQDKVEGPATCLPFLGIELDTKAMEIRLPADKLLQLRQTLGEWTGRKAGRKRALLSLIGLLNHACKAVRQGRSFLHRLINVAASVQKLDGFMRLNASAVRHLLVERICSSMEWNFYVNRGEAQLTRCYNNLRCIRFVGLWSLLWLAVVPATMVTVHYAVSHHNKRADTSGSGTSHLGKTVVWENSTNQM